MTAVPMQRLDLPPPDAPPDMSSLGDSERERLLRPPAPRWHDAYSLQLLDAHSWAALSAYPLKEDEWVMCMRALPIKDEITKQVRRQTSAPAGRGTKAAEGTLARSCSYAQSPGTWRVSNRSGIHTLLCNGLGCP